MKTLRNKFWALLLITSVALFSCKKEDPLSPMAKPSQTSEDVNTITRNDWRITTFNIGEMSETKLFSDYFFKFNKGEEIQALTSKTSEKGKWLMERNGETVAIEFASSPLNKLNREWRVMNKTDYDINLEQKNKLGEVVSLHLQRFKRIDFPLDTDSPIDSEVPTLE